MGLPKCLLRLLVVASAWSVCAVAEDSRAEAFIGYSEMPKVAEDVKAIELKSQYGTVIIRLRRDLAPNACALVAAHALTRTCSGCRFYRHEPVVDGWGENGQLGPPYGLLQGNIGLPQPPVHENPAKAPVMKWQVAMIGASSDFFIATTDHNEWGDAFSVWGEVDPRCYAETLAHPIEPFRSQTDAQNITTRWLLKDISFSLQPAVLPLV